MNQFRKLSRGSIAPFVFSVFLIAAVSLACAAPQVDIQVPDILEATQESTVPERETQVVPEVVPTLPAATPSFGDENGAITPVPQGGLPIDNNQALVNLYQQLIPGVVSISVFVNTAQGSGAAAGSGFIIDNDGHIVTNHHVVSGGDMITVSFFNGIEAEAELVGDDDDSDLAVIRVDNMPEDVYPLPLGDSDTVQVGEWVVAIGNPFELSGSMTIGIVSALGRAIESGFTPFSIPQAIQTDAAINPGNSGGPLLNLSGEVIGVNAQIATGGTVAANAGVGFAIPSNIVRKIAPTLIANGSYSWPWMGIEGTSVNLAVQEANNLPTQQGAYIDNVVSGGPAEAAGMRGSTGTARVSSLNVPVGGDVVIAVDGEPIGDFTDLLVQTANRNPGDEMVLTIVRGGSEQEITVTLAPRPSNFNTPTFP